MPSIGRIVVKGPARMSPAEGRRILKRTFGSHWPPGKKVKFLITPGGFLEIAARIREQGNCGWGSNVSDIKPFIAVAETQVKKMLPEDVIKAAKDKTKILTIGVDVFLEDDRHAELVAVFDVGKRKIVRWTGKSYPVLSQERSLVQVADLRSHFLRIVGERTMILGCHDLNIFSPRAWKNQKPSSHRRRRCSDMRKMAKRFKPTVVLQHPHTTDTPRIWRQAWLAIQNDYPSVKTWASGICYHNNRERRRAPLDSVLKGTRTENEQVVDIEVSKK